jgi:dephospho-CoA kinase
VSAARAYRVGLTGGLASGKSTVAAWLGEAGFEVVDADQLVAELHRPGGPGAAAARALFGEAVLTPAGGVDHAALAARLFSDPPARTAFERAIHPLVRRRFEEIAAGPAADDEPGSPPPQPAEAPEPPAPRPEDPRHPPGAERREPDDDDPLEPPQPERREPDGDPSGPSQPERQDPEDPARPGHPREAAAMTAPGAARRVVVLEATLLAEAGYAPGFDLIVTVEAPPEAQLSRAVARGLAEPAARARLAAQGDGARRRQAAHRVIENSGDLAELRRQVDALIADVRAAAAVATPVGAPAASFQAPDAASGQPATGACFPAVSAAHRPTAVPSAPVASTGPTRP